MCPGKGMLCGTMCTMEAKTNKCDCTGPCDGQGSKDPVKNDYGGGYGDWFL